MGPKCQVLSQTFYIICLLIFKHYIALIFSNWSFSENYESSCLYSTNRSQILLIPALLLSEPIVEYIP